MSVLTRNSIVHAHPIIPLISRTKHRGMTFGLGYCGYDVRVKQSLLMWPGRFVLASTVERFEMPAYLVGVVHDKSTWARRGIALQNTVIEPGWRGYLTLEITMHAWKFVRIRAGDPIAQIVFHRLDEELRDGYDGKYQDQPDQPVQGILDL